LRFFAPLFAALAVALAIAVPGHAAAGDALPPVMSPALCAQQTPEFTNFTANYVNQRIPAANRHPDPGVGGAAVNKLRGWVNQLPEDIGGSTLTASQPWINATFALYKADTSNAQKVTLPGVTWWQQLQQQTMMGVPVPADAVGNATNDSTVIIIDPGNQWIYDLWKFQRDPVTGAISSRAAGRISRYQTKEWVYNEQSDPPYSLTAQGSEWGVQASGFSGMAGLVTIDEALSGCIPHVIGLDVPRARAGRWCSPAQRTDGTDTTSSGIPYGCRFMLPADFDTDAYIAQRRQTDPTFNIGRMGRMIIEAWKNYGMVPMDQTGAGVGIHMESLTSWRSWDHTTRDNLNPFYGVNGQPGDADDLYEAWPNVIMKNLPWDKLYMLTGDFRTTP
jgi:hypothetical protein